MSKGEGRVQFGFKLTEDKVKRLLEAIELGASYRVACRMAGLVEFTFYRYKRIGIAVIDQIERAEEAGEAFPNITKEERLCAEMVCGIWDHEGKFTRRHLKNIQRAGFDDWRASAWALEKKWPLTYGRQIQEIHTHEQGDSDRAEESITIPAITEAVNKILTAKGVRGLLTAGELEDAMLEAEYGEERTGKAGADDED